MLPVGFRRRRRRTRRGYSGHRAKLPAEGAPERDGDRDAKAHLDGTFLLRTDDESLSAQDIVVGDTWRNIRSKLDRMHLVTMTTSKGTVSKRSELTPDQRHILGCLELPEPPLFCEFTPAPDEDVAPAP